MTQTADVLATTIAIDNAGLTDEQALGWLRDHSGRIETTISDLARQWSWNRTKVLRRLRAWEGAGVLMRAVREDGRSLIVFAQVDYAVEVPSELAPAIAEQPPFKAAFTLNGAMFGALALGALSLAIAWYGLRINAWYGALLGKTEEASALLSGLSVTADVVALVLPATARVLWAARCRSAALVAWLGWSVTMTIALLAAVGFASINIADTTAGRGRVAQQGSDLVAQIERLKAEHGAIGEKRPVAALLAELQKAQAAAATVWSRTAACTDITRKQSADACADVLHIRQSVAEAKRREAIEADLRETQAKLATLPAITSGDPQAELAARLANWATWDTLQVGTRDIELLRIAGMTILPQLSGLLLMLAGALCSISRGRRNQI